LTKQEQTDTTWAREEQVPVGPEHQDEVKDISRTQKLVPEQLHADVILTFEYHTYVRCTQGREGNNAIGDDQRSTASESHSGNKWPERSIANASAKECRASDVCKSTATQHQTSNAQGKSGDASDSRRQARPSKDSKRAAMGEEGDHAWRQARQSMQQSKAKQSKAKQSRAEQRKAKKNKAKHSTAKQGKAEQSKARQSKATHDKA
jgi:hypothetical protein